MSTDKFKVLHIEDNILVADIVNQILIRLGYKVDHFTSAEAGMAPLIINPKEYQLIICDGELPGQNGPDAVIEMRKRGVVTPIIAHSADPYINAKMKTNGADASIQKTPDTNMLGSFRRAIDEAKVSYNDRKAKWIEKQRQSS